MGKQRLSKGEVIFEKAYIKTLSLNGTDITATAAELNKMDGVTATAAEINKVDNVPATAYLVMAEERTFTETTGAGTYTASVTVPAGGTLLDVRVESTALWTATTSATMKVGDAGDDDGIYIGIDLKATDLLVGEVIRFESTGGKEGAYVVPASGTAPGYSATARVVSGVVTTVGAAGNAGRTRMTVLYSVPTAVAATKA